MAVPDYIENEKVQRVLANLEELKLKKPIRVSDVFDAQGNQYVDLVQEGGGVLGIALVGYTFIMEEAGIRFRSLAGTSAGAINTVLMAAAGPIHVEKSRQILKYLATQDLFALLDGSRGTKKLINGFIRNRSAGYMIWAALLHIRSVIRTIRERFGLNPGDEVKRWCEEMIHDFGIENTGQLKAQMNLIPDGFCYRKDDAEQGIGKVEAKMAVIASEVTTKTKVEFPKMSGLYWKDPDAVHPAEFIRASMSIPLFFDPYRVKHLPNAGKPATKNWDDMAGYRGEIPRTALFVDGGLLSNFPINVFHRKSGEVPRLPTFGARLSNKRTDFSRNESLFEFSGSMINTMRQLHDYDFLRQNNEYKMLICQIDASEEYNWLDFDMPEDRKIALFAHGCEKALEFLKEFEWDKYKKCRANPEEYKNGKNESSEDNQE